ncbi:hypothetical protein AN218_20195, partial [Streptomyces nanshensis]
PKRRPRTPVLVADHGRTVGREEPAETAETDETQQRPERGDRRRTDRPGASDRHGAPERSASAEGSASPPTAPSASGTVSGLPRRVRQASLAPQLKREPEEGAAGRTGGGAPSEDLANRDAEEVRSRMASLQRGWQRGRRDNAGASGDEATDSAPGTTPEGDGR